VKRLIMILMNYSIGMVCIRTIVVLMDTIFKSNLLVLLDPWLPFITAVVYFILYKTMNNKNRRAMTIGEYLIGRRLNQGKYTLKDHSSSLKFIQVILLLNYFIFMMMYTENRYYSIREILILAVIFGLSLYALKLLSDGKLIGLLNLILCQLFVMLNNYVIIDDTAEMSTYMMLSVVVILFYAIVYLYYKMKHHPSFD
jgi:hypothetical protein